MIKLAPSILSADFTRLGEEIKILENESVPYIHIDVMDGMFVPNISMGIPIIESIRKVTDLVLDVHLMIEKPERYIEAFAKCGADIITFHAEACQNIPYVINKIKSLNKKVGLSIKPRTSHTELLKYIEYLDLALVMSVEPGFGGQRLISQCLNKAGLISEYIRMENLGCELEMDGGINLDNVSSVIATGCNVIVTGSSIFETADMKSQIKRYKEIFNSYEVEYAGCNNS